MKNTRLVTQWAALFCVAAFFSQTSSSTRAATVADWTFEEGVPGQPVTTVVDYSGNGHTGSTVWGSPTFAQSGPGAVGNVSISLPQASGFRPQDSAAFNFPTQFTLEIEFKPGTTNAGWRYLVGDFIPNGGDVLGLAYRSDPSSIGMGPLVGPLAVPFPLDGQSHHVAAVYTNQVLTLYLDGQARSSTNINLGPPFAGSGSPMRLCVGSDYTGGFSFNGVVDRVRVSNQALQPQDFFSQQPTVPATVADWTFEEGTPSQTVTSVFDYSGNGHNGSVVWGSPTFVPSGPGAFGNVSVNLPQASGFRPQDSVAFNFPSQFTLEIEFKPGTNNAGWRYLVGDFIPNGADVLGLGYRSDPSSIGMGPLIGPLAVPFPLDGQSHHVAAVYVSQTLTLFLDGVARSSTAINLGPTFAASGAPMRLCVGSDYNAGFWFNGVIDRVRISNQALSPVDFFFQPSLIGDGIPDAWRLKYFGTNFVNDPRSAANADPDHDGADNFQEFLAGTDPTNSGSVPSVPAIVSTYAGAVGGNQDGFRSTARFDGSITDLSYGPGGTIWLLESSVSGDMQRADTGGQRIRTLDTNGIVTTLTGGTNGFADGPLSQALFSIPNGLAFDSAGNAFIADQGNNRIRKIGTNGVVSTLAGSTAGYQDGVGTNAQFNAPSGLAIDANENLYVADSRNQKIRLITPEGLVSTFTGNYGAPIDVAIAKDGALFVADAANGAIHRITTNGLTTLFAAGVPFLEHLSLDSTGGVYAASSAGSLYKFNPDGSLAWSVGSTPGYRDGLAATAQFVQLGRPLMLPDGSLIVGDFYHIRQITIGIPPLLLFTPGGGTFTNSLAVAIHSAVNGGVIRYTLDGTAPSTNSPVYTDFATNSLTLTNSTAITITLQATVFVNGLPVSQIASATYTNTFNAWLAQIFGPNFATNAQAAPTADPDGDGSNNYQEFLDGTNPLDPKSVKIHVTAQIVPLLVWNSVSNQVYRVLRRDDPNSINTLVVAPSILATNTTTSFVDPNPNLKAFYWIELGTNNPTTGP